MSGGAGAPLWSAGEPWVRRDTRWLLALVTLALAVRIVVLAFTPVCGVDSGRYLTAAREFEKGVWEPSMETVLPGYPMATVVVGGLFGDLETAAWAVPLIAGSLALIPFFWLVRDVAGRRVAVLSGLFYVFLSWLVLVQADAMTEGLFHFFFLTSVALVWYAVTRASGPHFALAGFAGAFAYLTRIEGVYAIPALAGMAGLRIIAELRRKSGPIRGSVAGWAAAGLVAFVAAASPQLVRFRSEAGWWNPIHHASAQYAVKAIQGEEMQGRFSDRRRDLWGALGEFRAELFDTGAQVVPLLAVAGLFFLRRRVSGLGGAYLGCLAGGYALGPVAAAVNGYPVSERYAMGVTLFLIPFAAIGAIGGFEALRRRWPHPRLPQAAAALCALLFVAMAGRAVVHRVKDRVPKLAMKEAAFWVRGQATEASVFYSDETRFWWYLGRRARTAPKTREEIERFELRPGDFLLIREKQFIQGFPEASALLASRHSVRRFSRPDGPDRLTVAVFYR